MLGSIVSKLIPRPWMIYGGVGVAGATVLFGLSMFSQTSQDEKRFIDRLGKPSELQRREAYLAVLKSGKALEENMGDFESNTWTTTLRRKLYASAKGEVLEVGIGPGRGFPLLAQNKRITSYVGVDIEPDAVTMSQAACLSANLSFPTTIRTADFHNLPFPDKSFDTVVSCFSLCSAEKPGNFLKELARVSRGRVLLLEHGVSSYSLVRFIGKLTGMFPDLTSAWAVGCTQELETDEEINKAGLRIVRRERGLLGHVCFFVCE